MPDSYQQRIICFKAFIHEDWQNNVTKDEFQEFRVTGYDPDIAAPIPIPLTVTSSGPSTSGSSPFPIKPRDLDFGFKKGIKQDPASFTILMDHKQCDGVHQTLKAQTCNQDVAAILEPNYVPQTKEDIALFEEKQKNMYYSVLERILQTDEGKVIVCEHDANRDAQAIYTEFLTVMTSSTKALMNLGTLLMLYLTNARISNGTWKGTSKTFILNWMNKLRIFHELTPFADRLSEQTQRILLQNTVLGLDALRQVQINSDLQNTTGALTFAQYRSLLINVVTGL